MNLKDLIAAGAIAKSGFDDAVTRSVTWEGNTFDVKIKRDISAADFEFIYAQAKDDEDSYSARRVHRFVMLTEEERIPYETARQMKSSLLIAICSAINSVHDQKAIAEKKNLGQRKKSGTS